MSGTTVKTGLSAALATTTLLGLAACSDPGASAASSANPTSSSSSGVKTFTLSPQQDRVKATVDKAAAALVPDTTKKDGKLTVAVSPFSAPLAVYATDNKTPVGNEVDVAVALTESLGLEAEIVPTAWADWPLGVDSGKYEAVLSNVTVTEERKLNSTSPATATTSWLLCHVRQRHHQGGDRAGSCGQARDRGSGTNQESILLRWDEESKKNGLKPVEFQFYDDDSASRLAFQAASDANGLAAAAAAGLNHLIEDDTYARIVDRWGLNAEAVKKSEVNPAGLPKK